MALDLRAMAAQPTYASNQSSTAKASDGPLTPEDFREVRSSKIFFMPDRTPSAEFGMRASQQEDEAFNLAAGLLSSQFFKISSSVVIIADSIRLGLEQSYRLNGHNVSAIMYVGHAFLVACLLELGLKIFVRKFESLQSNWLRFDCLVVFVNILALWVLEPLQMDTNQVLPIFARILRILRTMRLMAHHPELFVLVRGMWFCTRSAICAVLSLGILFYTFGCMSLELIPLHFQGREDALSESVKEIIETNFDSLPMAILTLVQFMTLDDVVHIYRPLIEADEKLFVFFLVLIAIFGIFMITSLISTMVQGGMEQAALEKDMHVTWLESKRKRLLRDLKQAFFQADTDLSGEVSREELACLNEEDKRMLNSILGVDILRVFDCLDVNRQRSLEIDKFLDGIESVSLLHGTVHAMHMERMVEALFQQMKETQQKQSELRRSMQLITSVLRPEREDCPTERSITSTDALFSSASACRPSTPTQPGSLPGPSPAHGGTSIPGPGRGASTPPFTGQLSERSQPLWVDRLVLKVQDVVALEMKSVLEHACSIIVDDATLRPEMPHSMLGAAAAVPKQAAEPGWEALPPARCRFPQFSRTSSRVLHDRTDSDSCRGDSCSNWSHEIYALRTESPARLRPQRADGSVPECQKPVFLCTPEKVDSTASSTWET